MGQVLGIRVVEEANILIAMVGMDGEDCRLLNLEGKKIFSQAPLLPYADPARGR